MSWRVPESEKRRRDKLSERYERKKLSWRMVWGALRNLMFYVVWGVMVFATCRLIADVIRTIGWVK